MPRKTETERKQLLKNFENFFEVPLIVLGFIWLSLVIVELVYKTSPALETIGVVIWIIFIVDFVIKLLVAPSKKTFLKSNILTIISLAVPAFRVLRVIRLVRLIRLTRGLRLIKILGSINRSMRALSATMKRRAFGYVLLLTLIVLFAGAAGMYAFEKDSPNGFAGYGTALWWTAMILTTMGSEYWPKTPEGQMLCIILALYAFGVFGYFTATIASFFIGRDAEDKKDIAGVKQLEELKKEIELLKELIKSK